MAEAVDEKSNSVPSKITGEDEQHCADVTPNKDMRTNDSLNTIALDTIITVTAVGVPVELKVGGSVAAERKYIVMEALDTGVKWGFSSGTQSFDLFKSQLIMLPLGPGKSIWFDIISGTNKQVAIGELS
jgi:hypothetical protein